jgi:fido (protein-threonine AMPylation protein)
MPDDLPIYPDSPTLRSGMQFADLLRFSAVDTTAIWEKSDEFIARMEGASSVAKARMALTEPGKSGLLEAHGLLFAGQAGAGMLRQTLIAGRYPGQDCPEPEYIDNSLNNFFGWMSAESMAEVHPIEKAALVLTRIVDVWPFGSGNLTVAVMLSNAYLKQAGLPPFFVLPDHMDEFNKILAQAVKIETQPLVNAIHKTLKREIEAIAR